jgi:hypothetical protein
MTANLVHWDVHHAATGRTVHPIRQFNRETAAPVARANPALSNFCFDTVQAPCLHCPGNTLSRWIRHKALKSQPHSSGSRQQRPDQRHTDREVRSGKHPPRQRARALTSQPKPVAHATRVDAVRAAYHPRRRTTSHSSGGELSSRCWLSSTPSRYVRPLKEGSNTAWLLNQQAVKAPCLQR